MTEKKKRIHVVINPASGKDEPILNVINAVFKEHDVEWSISVTQKFGDATEFARQAAADGYDIVAGYGGDGTQHEIANGIMGSDALMGVLPGGTGNGFANEMGIPNKLRPALEVLCTSENVREIDIVKMDKGYFIQRLYVGIEPEQQTSREDKDKYGTFAYAISAFHRLKEAKEIQYKIQVDGELYEVPAMKLYVVNSAKSGTSISVTGDFSSVDDGLLDVFVLNLKNLRTLAGATERMINLNTKDAKDSIRQGKEITIETDPDQPVWTDGEYTGRTPVSMKVLPGALSVIAPAS
jgi:YegS/Rv2252/BmrU family lipid kinase